MGDLTNPCSLEQEVTAKVSEFENAQAGPKFNIELQFFQVIGQKSNT